jgi:Ca2+-binding EF-hand superfamily protein
MIEKAGGDESGIGKKQFKGIMLPIMQDQLLSQEDNIEDLRLKFLEADVDGSGALSVDELFAALKKSGAQVTCEDIVQLVTEIDVDRDGELDIDEFVALMTHGGQMTFKNQNNKAVQSRQRGALRFLQAF